MKLFLAGLHSEGRRLPIVKPPFIMGSFLYGSKRFYEYIHSEDCKDFILDSGAFTFMSGKDGDIDWDKYCDNYADFITRNKFKRFIEIDIDVVVGLPRVEDLRARLEDRTGLACIPVFHRSRGKDKFYEILESHKFIALGGIAIKDIKRDEFKYFKWFIKEAHDRDVGIHGLGFSHTKLFKEYDFDSVDSTTWMRARFGNLYVFSNGKMKVFQTQGKYRIKDHHAISIHGLQEWVKYIDYMNQRSS